MLFGKADWGDGLFGGIPPSWLPRFILMRRGDYSGSERTRAATGGLVPGRFPSRRIKETALAILAVQK